MKNIEITLKELFAFQAFADNPHLKKLIEDTESRYGRELSDDLLGFINAAGEIDVARLTKKDGGEDDE